MLKIGDFSKLAHVTIKALRHYDELGLLRPVWIDRYTGYRYYRLEQLPRLNRILALKDLGFTLEQVGELLAADLPADRLRQLFDQQQMAVQQRLLAEQERLERVAERLRQIEQEGRLPVYDVTLRALPALAVASMRAFIPQPASLAEQRPFMQRFIGEWAAQAGLHPAGPWVTVFHNPAYAERNLDVEIALPVTGEALKAGGAPSRARRWVGLRELPALPQMAGLLHPTDSGPVESAYNALFAWAEHGGYQVTGPLRQVWLEESSSPVPLPASAPSGSTCSLVEVQAPVESTQDRKRKYFSLTNRKESDMEPNFVHLPALQVVGLRYYGKNENQEISALWGEFNRVSSQVQNMDPAAAYGMCFTVPGAPNGEFEYVAGFNVTKVENVPAQMVVRSVPASKYAVFAHVGPLDKLRETYHYIYQTWLPQSGCELGGNWDFEYYNEEFKDFAPDSKFYIYVPVK